MRKILLIVFTVILFLIFISWYNASPKVIISRLMKNKDALRGRQLVYRVYFLRIFPMGEAVLMMPEEIEEYKGRKVYHLRATANNLRLFSNFVNAYANLDSYIDIRQLTPVLFKQKLVVTGRKDTYREVFYDQTNHIMSIEKVRRQILPDTQDPLSAIFNVRRMDFDNIKKLEMFINTNQKNYILKGTAKTKNISIGKKTYKIALLESNISRHDKNPYHKSSIDIILLDEGSNIPISVNVFTRGILLNARLIDIK